MWKGVLKRRRGDKVISQVRHKPSWLKCCLSSWLMAMSHVDFCLVVNQETVVLRIALAGLGDGRLHGQK